MTKDEVLICLADFYVHSVTESGFHFKVGHGWLPEDHHHNIFDHHHHHGHHGGWGWHSRRRRAAESDARGETADIETSQYDPSYDEVLSYDQLGCGMRLVCELAATPQEQLADDGKLILELFG